MGEWGKVGRVRCMGRVGLAEQGHKGTTVQRHIPKAPCCDHVSAKVDRLLRALLQEKYWLLVARPNPLTPYAGAKALSPAPLTSLELKSLQLSDKQVVPPIFRTPLRQELHRAGRVRLEDNDKRQLCRCDTRDPGVGSTRTVSSPSGSRSVMVG